MAMLTLVVRPDGRALLTSARRLTDSERFALVAQIREWEAGKWPLVVLDGVDVVRIESLDIDLGEPQAELEAVR